MSCYVRDLKPGMTREEVVALWGEPDEKGGSSRKYKKPSIFKYGPVEVTFNPVDGGLMNVWVRDANDLLRTLLPAIDWTRLHEGKISPSEWETPRPVPVEELAQWDMFVRSRCKTQEEIDRRVSVIRAMIERLRLELSMIEPMETKPTGPEYELADLSKRTG